MRNIILSGNNSILYACKLRLTQYFTEHFGIDFHQVATLFAPKTDEDYK